MHRAERNNSTKRSIAPRSPTLVRYDQRNERLVRHRCARKRNGRVDYRARAEPTRHQDARDRAQEPSSVRHRRVDRSNDHLLFQLSRPYVRHPGARADRPLSGVARERLRGVAQAGLLVRPPSRRCSARSEARALLRDGAAAERTRCPHAPRRRRRPPRVAPRSLRRGLRRQHGVARLHAGSAGRALAPARAERRARHHRPVRGRRDGARVVLREAVRAARRGLPSADEHAVDLFTLRERARPRRRARRVQSRLPVPPLRRNHAPLFPRGMDLGDSVRQWNHQRRIPIGS
jgi:hypothetical protein